MVWAMTSVPDTILVAITDPVLHPEAIHVAAASGRRVIDTTDPAEITRHYPRVDAILVDVENAAALSGLARRRQIYFLAADPGPVDWRAALECQAEQALVIPAQAAELLAALGREGLTTAAEGMILGVMGAAGGAGASTFAASLGRVAGPAATPTLIDADPGAGGLDLLLGLEDATGARWPELTLGAGAVAAADLRAALPATPDQIRVLTGARTTVADSYRLTAAEVIAALTSFRRSTGLTVVDLPRGGELAEEVLEHCDTMVLLVPAEVRPVAAAAQLLNRWRAHQVRTALVARHRGWSGLDVSDLERITRGEVVAELPTVSRLARQLEIQGLPLSLPKPLARAAEAVLADLAPGRLQAVS